MAEHTPGPWHLFTNRHPTTDGRQWGCVVAGPHLAGGAGKLPAGMKIYWEGPEGKANARVIAAVTDLLAALEEAELLMEEMRPTFHVAARLAHANAKAAIAKARGQEEE